MEDLECERTLTHNTHTHGRKRTVLYGSHDFVENYCKCNSVWRTRENKSVLKYQQYHLVAPSQRGTKSHSRTFSFTVPGWWNELPTLILNPWQFSSDTWKLISSITWLHLKKKHKKTLPFLNFALFSLNSHHLARIGSEQCLEICITSTSYVCLPLYNVLLIVFFNCKSLWRKASAKLINVNVIKN